MNLRARHESARCGHDPWIGIALAGRSLDRGRVHGWLLRGSTVLLCLTAALSLMGLPLETTVPALDPSWVEAYAHFTQTNAQAGVDYLFTYGPLAHFIAPVYDPDLYFLDLIMGALIAVLLTIPFVWAAVRRKNLVTTLFIFWLVFVLVPRSMGNEVGACAAMITVTILLLEDSRKSPAVYALVGVVFAFFSLLKFSMTVMGCASMGVLVLQWFLPDNKVGRPLWILALIGSYALAFLVFWVLAGQDIKNIATYIFTSIEVSRAYVMGMHTPMNPRYFVFSIGLAGLLLFQVGLFAAHGKEGSPNARAVLLFVCLALVLAWKMGVARSQPPKFYVPAATVSILLCTSRSGSLPRRALRQCAPLLALTLATMGILTIYERTFYEHLEWSIVGAYEAACGLASPLEKQTRYDKIRNGYRKAYEYPEIKRMAGGDTIDIFPPLQSVLLFNDLNYHPRPVFQGYQACSPQLAERNGAFYASAEAPKYVLRLPVLSAIDGRFPMTEDAEAIKALYRNYRPVLWEEYLLLLERKDVLATAKQDVQVKSISGVARVNAWVTLEDPGPNWQLLSLRLKPSLAGRVREFLFQPPMPMIEIRHTNGEVKRWRINIGSIESGFIINPVFDPIETVEAWPGASTTRRVEAIRVTLAEGQDWVLQPEFGYSVATVLPLARPAE